MSITTDLSVVNICLEISRFCPWRSNPQWKLTDIFYLKVSTWYSTRIFNNKNQRQITLTANQNFPMENIFKSRYFILANWITDTLLIQKQLIHCKQSNLIQMFGCKSISCSCLLLLCVSIYKGNMYICQSSCIWWW